MFIMQIDFYDILSYNWFILLLEVNEMKKIILSVFVASLVLVLVCALAGCEHTHEWSEWKTTKEPTCTEKGVEERVCECGEKETQDVD